MPDPKKNAQNQDPVLLKDYKENEQHLHDVQESQKTTDDLLWYAVQYRIKNDLLVNGANYTKEEREKYGFNLSGNIEARDESFMRDLRETVKNKLRTGTLEDYKNYFRSIGSLKAKAFVMNGTQYDLLLKALAEDTDHPEKKAIFLLNAGGLNNKAGSCIYHTTDTDPDIREVFREEILPKEFDLKKVTFRQFAERMGIDYEEMKKGLPEGADNVYEYVRELSPHKDEDELLSDADRFHDHYGAGHSNRTAEDYNRPKVRNQQEINFNAPAEDLQNPRVSEAPNFPKTDDIPKTPEIPRIPHILEKRLFIAHQADCRSKNHPIHRRLK